MIEKITEFAKKGLRIGVYPIIEKEKHYWIACVRVGESKKLTWIPKEEGCPMSGFSTPENAYNAIIEFCENYEEPKKRRSNKG